MIMLCLFIVENVGQIMLVDVVFFLWNCYLSLELILFGEYWIILVMILGVIEYRRDVGIFGYMQSIILFYSKELLGQGV